MGGLQVVWLSDAGHQSILILSSPFLPPHSALIFPSLTSRSCLISIFLAQFMDPFWDKVPRAICLSRHNSMACFLLKSCQVKNTLPSLQFFCSNPGSPRGKLATSELPGRGSACAREKSKHLEFQGLIFHGHCWHNPGPRIRSVLGHRMFSYGLAF